VKLTYRPVAFLLGLATTYLSLYCNSAVARKLFNVYCNPLDIGSADCRTLPDGIKISCIAASGGLAQCLDPTANKYVNCVPYQVMMPGDVGGAAVQLACYSNVQSGAQDSRFDRNRLNNHEFESEFDDPFAP